MAKYVLYFDGLCEPNNPGGIMCFAFAIHEAADGCPVRDNCAQGVLSTPAKSENTNNIAEYKALWLGLKAILDRTKCDELTIQGDSMLVINQLTDRWAINKSHLLTARNACLELLKQIGCKWEANWIAREMNAEADNLCRQEYKRLTGLEAPVRGKRKA